MCLNHSWFLTENISPDHRSDHYFNVDNGDSIRVPLPWSCREHPSVTVVYNHHLFLVTPWKVLCWLVQDSFFFTLGNNVATLRDIFTLHTQLLTINKHFIVINIVIISPFTKWISLIGVAADCWLIWVAKVTAYCLLVGWVAAEAVREL